jgi:hypothetical protein
MKKKTYGKKGYETSKENGETRAQEKLRRKCRR